MPKEAFYSLPCCAVWLHLCCEARWTFLILAWTNFDKSAADPLECKMATNLLFLPPKSLLSRSYSRPKSTASKYFTTSPSKSYSARTKWHLNGMGQWNAISEDWVGIGLGMSWVSLGTNTFRFRASYGAKNDIRDACSTAGIFIHFYLFSSTFIHFQPF